MTTNSKDKNLDAFCLHTFPLSLNTHDHKEINVIDIYDTETHDIRNLQQLDAYCKCIINTIYIPIVLNKFILKDGTLIQDTEKYFKALVVPKSLT